MHFSLIYAGLWTEQPPGAMNVSCGPSCHICDTCHTQRALRDLTSPRIFIWYWPQTLFFSYWVHFKGPKVACESRKLHGVQTNFELQLAGNRIENFTKTPLFSGSAQQGPSSIEQVRMKANQERKPFQTTTSVTKAVFHNQGTSRVGSYFNQSIPYGFPWCSNPVQKKCSTTGFFLMSHK